MPDAERAIERLYEDAAVRDSLTDDDAQMLLRWGEDQIMRLADTSADEAAFDALLDQLRQLLKGVNRFVGERGQMDAATRATRLDGLLATGQALGAAPAAAASSLAESFAGGDDTSTLNALLGLLTPLDAEASAEPAPPSAPDAPAVQPRWPWQAVPGHQPAPDAPAETPRPPEAPDPDDTGDTSFDDETQDDWFD